MNSIEPLDTHLAVARCYSGRTENQYRSPRVAPARGRIEGLVRGNHVGGAHNAREAGPTARLPFGSPDATTSRGEISFAFALHR